MDSLVYYALSTIDLENISLDVFNEICMFCFVKSEKLELVNAISRTELFWKLSNIQITNTELPQKICHICLQTFKSVSKFVDQINGNIVRFKELYQQKLTQLKTVSITPKLEPEEFEYDEPEIVKIEEIDDDNSDKIQQTEIQENVEEEMNGKKSSTSEFFKCSLCDKEFATKFKLQYHRLSHKAPEEFQCFNCGKIFKTKPHMKRHILKIHLKVRNHKCDICGKGFFSQSELNHHLNSHTGNTPYVCSYCGNRFRKYTTLVVHNQYHKLKNGEIQQDENTKPYLKLQCEICKKIFTTRHSLKLHIASQHETSASTEFPCNKCDQAYSTRFKLNKHISNVHFNYECANCVKTFRLKASFMSHMLKYHKLTLSSCDLCKKTFTCQEDLKKHEEIHTKTKSYNCVTCKKAYNNHKYFMIHVRTHKGSDSLNNDVNSSNENDTE